MCAITLMPMRSVHVFFITLTSCLIAYYRSLDATRRHAIDLHADDCEPALSLILTPNAPKLLKH